MWKRTDADKFVVAMLGVHLAVFVFYNFHSYYYLPLIPFAALAAARGLWTFGVKSTARVAVAAGLIALLCLPYSGLVLSAKKLSVLRLDEAARMLAKAGYDPKRDRGRDLVDAGRSVRPRREVLPG